MARHCVSCTAVQGQRCAALAEANLPASKMLKRLLLEACVCRQKRTMPEGGAPAEDLLLLPLQTSLVRATHLKSQHLALTSRQCCRQQMRRTG